MDFLASFLRNYCVSMIHSPVILQLSLISHFQATIWLAWKTSNSLQRWNLCSRWLSSEEAFVLILCSHFADLSCDILCYCLFFSSLLFKQLLGTFYIKVQKKKRPKTTVTSVCTWDLPNGRADPTILSLPGAGPEGKCWRVVYGMRCDAPEWLLYAMHSPTSREDPCSNPGRAFLPASSSTYILTEFVSLVSSLATTFQLIN